MAREAALFAELLTEHAKFRMDIRSVAQALATQRVAAVHVVELRDADPESGRACAVSVAIIFANSRSASVAPHTEPATLAERESGLCSR